MKALIIEDEKRLADALVRILQDHKYMVEVVFDGQSGIDYAKGAQYDVILLDVMLPDLDGFEVVRAIRKAKVDTPVLILTAKDSVPDKVMGLNAGADDYMTKPFSPEELAARVNALTRRLGSVVLSSLAVGDIALDLESADLRCGGESVHLSHKEFEVMRLLIKSHLTVVPKETLITQVWGADSNAEDNNVEAYISFLRRKLKFLNSGMSIRNIQRIGYRLEEGNA